METTGLQHVAARERIFTKLSPFPHPTGLRRYFDYLMYAVGSLAPLALVPQVVEIYGHKNASGLAASTWIILTMINLLWVAYGVLHTERPIVVANTGMLLLNLSVVIGIFLYA